MSNHEDAKMKVMKEGEQLLKPFKPIVSLLDPLKSSNRFQGVWKMEHWVKMGSRGIEIGALG